MFVVRSVHIHSAAGVLTGWCQSPTSTHKNFGQSYEILQNISKDIFLSSFFLLNWRILRIWWWQGHV